MATTLLGKIIFVLILLMLAGVVGFVNADPQGLNTEDSEDSDGDEVSDENDKLQGDENSVEVKGIENMYVEVDGYNSTEPGASTITGKHNVSFKSNGKPVVETEINFSKAQLDITNAEIKKEEEGSRHSVVVNGIESNVSIEKTIYLEKEKKDSSVCVVDKEIDSINDMSRHCDGEDEYYFSDCDGKTKDGITCNIENGDFKVSGLEHSAVAELNFTGLYTGHFTVQYTNEVNNHRDGYIMPGESVKLCFETPRSIQNNEYIRLAFVPSKGSVTVNELYTPNVMTLKNVHLYP